MTAFQDVLQGYLDEPEDLTDLGTVLENQANEAPVGSAVRYDTLAQWAIQKRELEALFKVKTDIGVGRALRVLAKIVDTLELYSPALKGLQEAHAFATEHLENLVFDEKISDIHAAAAAYLYGQAMGMSTLTAEAIAPAVENVLQRQDAAAATIALSVLLGVERSNSPLFENHLPVLLRQVQIAAFSGRDKQVSQDALLAAMKVYTPNDKYASCALVLQSVHALLVASLRLCEIEHTMSEGVQWTCFIISNMPMRLRLDLQRQYPRTCEAVPIFATLAATFANCNTAAQASLCGALPILTTWSTTDFVNGTQVTQSVDFMLGLCETPGLQVAALGGLGWLSNVVLDEYEPFLARTAKKALDLLDKTQDVELLTAAQTLLGQLLAALGPITLDIMVDYLRLPPLILLADVQLLQSIATLLPQMSRRITQTLTEIIEDLISGKVCAFEHAAVLNALNVFPLNEPELARRAQRLVLWSLDEDRGKDAVMAALQLAINPSIAKDNVVQQLTFRAAQLLLADDPHVVHLSLNVLSDPTLASMLDERSCSMILLALHQSLEPSIQIVAAKLLTHLTTAHRAIVQPLAWSHIRQSLSLMDFLKSVDPTRAIIEACIISNLLPALPQSLHKKYVGPVKQLILSGLERSSEGASTLSLVFQGLANLAKFEGWGAVQQTTLAMDLLDMTQEIPKDSQHAALNAISRLLSVPTEGLEVYDLLIRVHATFGGVAAKKLDVDLKSLVSGIYGHLGTVERNPVISRDSKAAINRETSVYSPKSQLLSQVAEIQDKHGATSQIHINWLVTKNLIAAFGRRHKSIEDRSLVLEIMTCFGILQPQAIATLIPDLPQMIFAELRSALRPKDGSAGRERDVTPISAAVLFLASCLHMNPGWLARYWNESAEIMAEVLKEGEVLPVLRGLGVVLDSIVE